MTQLTYPPPPTTTTTTTAATPFPQILNLSFLIHASGHSGLFMAPVFAAAVGLQSSDYSKFVRTFDSPSLIKALKHICMEVCRRRQWHLQVQYISWRLELLLLSFPGNDQPCTRSYTAFYSNDTLGDLPILDKQH